MFWSLKVIFAFALLFAAVAAAPISATNTTSHSVDSETLLSNAQEAQHLNDQFQDLQLDDSCTGKPSSPSPSSITFNEQPRRRNRVHIQRHCTMQRRTVGNHPALRQDPKVFRAALTNLRGNRTYPSVSTTTHQKANIILDHHLYKRADCKIPV